MDGRSATLGDRRSIGNTVLSLELPDLRIEYEAEDGRIEHRDVEIVTEHYSRGQLAGKARAGFACYRAAGSGRGRGRDGRSQRGSTPFDPRHLERL